MRSLIAAMLCMLMLQHIEATSVPLYQQAEAPIEQRVEDLLSRMNLTEKIAQLEHPWAIGTNHSSAYISAYPVGLGAVYLQWIGEESVANGNDWVARAKQINDLQSWYLQNTRLGIPVSVVDESLHSGSCQGSVFPMPCGLGASWNASLLQSVGAVIAAEVRSSGSDRGFSPEINVATDPRFGRTEENFGEDPAHVSAMGAAMALGLQGSAGGPSQYLPSPDRQLTCEAKHAAAYAQGGRDAYPADVSPQTLFDVYLRPWRDFLAKAGGRGLMASHNSVNGMPAHGNHWLLNQTLRELFNASDILIASDDSDIGQLTKFHIVSDLSSAAVLAIEAGMDQDLHAEAFPLLEAAVNQGQVSIDHVDRAVRNVLRQKFGAGLFDGYWRVNATHMQQTLRAPQHTQLSIEASRQAITLLQNSGGVLPLSLDELKGKTVAVVGPTAGCFEDPVGDDCRASSNQLGGYTSTGAPVTTVLAAITAAGNASGFTVVSSQGAETDSLIVNNTMLDAAVALAMRADVVIAVVGDSSEGYGKGTCAEGIDRDSLDLPGTQLDLLSAIAGNLTLRQSGMLRAGGPGGDPHSWGLGEGGGNVPAFVVTLVHGRPVTFGEGQQSRFGPRNDLLRALPAVLSAWRPGAQGGDAIWEVITGAVNPSGRLAQGWPRTVGQIRQSNPWYQLQGTPTKQYSLDAQFTPLFRFGFGLSYGTFQLSNFRGQGSAEGAVITADTSGLPRATNVPNAYRVTSQYVREAAEALRQGKSGGMFSLEVDVALASGQAGALPVQAYYSQELSSRVRFQQMLLGFDKVHVGPGAPATAAIGQVTADQMGYYHPVEGDYILEAGNYTVSVSQSSDLSGAPSLTIVVPPPQ